LTLTSGGSGYTTAPTVAINGGGGSGATATSTIGPSRIDQTNTWDVENRPVSVTSTGASAQYVYDANGNRVKETENGATILYINRYFEVKKVSGQADVVTSYYYLGNKLIAEMEGTTLRYLHQDSLSSTSLVTNSSGSIDGSYTSTYPFGLTRSGTLPVDEQFTGQRLDATGLYYYEARYYDPSIGRFINADTMVTSIVSPQALRMLGLRFFQSVPSQHP